MEPVPQCSAMYETKFPQSAPGIFNKDQKFYGLFKAARSFLRIVFVVVVVLLPVLMNLAKSIVIS